MASNIAEPKQIFYLPAPVALSNAYGIEFETLGVGAIGQLISGLITSFSSDGGIGDMAAKAGSAVATAGTRLLDDIGAANLFKRKFGFSFNKYNELSIGKPNLRTFNLSFDFAPFSQEDAANAEKMIKLLKLGMHPTTEQFLKGTDDANPVEAGQGSAGSDPSLFNPIFRNPLKYVIDFIWRGQKNKDYTKIYKTAPCFIAALNVNYHRAGAPSYLPNGEPTMSSIDLTFNEIFPLTRDALRQVEGIKEDIVQAETPLISGAFGDA